MIPLLLPTELMRREIGIIPKPLALVKGVSEIFFFCLT